MFTSLLSEIKGKTPVKKKTPSISKKISSSSPTPPTTSNNETRRSYGSKRPPGSSINQVSARATIDPAVLRLKAARRAEKEKEAERKAQEKRQRLINMGIDPDAKRSRKKVENKENKETRQLRKGGVKRSRKVEEVPLRSSQSPKKKLKFSDLMKQAAKVDGSGLAINLNAKQKKEDEFTKHKKTNPYRNKESSPMKKITKKESIPAPVTAKKARIAAPSAELQKKLEKRKQIQERNAKRRRLHGDDGYEYEDEDDDFVVDDEEYDAGGYDKDEIWKIFNKGKARRYDDYSDESDMEAAGEDIFEEEERSAKQAALEEKREKELEKKLLREKQKRLARYRN